MGQGSSSGFIRVGYLFDDHYYVDLSNLPPPSNGFLLYKYPEIITIKLKGSDIPPLDEKIEAEITFDDLGVGKVNFTHENKNYGGLMITPAELGLVQRKVCEMVTELRKEKSQLTKQNKELSEENEELRSFKAHADAFFAEIEPNY